MPAGGKEWVMYQEAEYKFFEHHSTWLQAKRICSWFQAELTSVHSKAELHFLGQNLKKVPREQELPRAAVAMGSATLWVLFLAFFHLFLEGPYFGMLGFSGVMMDLCGGLS